MTQIGCPDSLYWCFAHSLARLRATTCHAPAQIPAGAAVRSGGNDNLRFQRQNALSRSRSRRQNAAIVSPLSRCNSIAKAWNSRPFRRGYDELPVRFIDIAFLLLISTPTDSHILLFNGERGIKRRTLFFYYIVVKK